MPKMLFWKFLADKCIDETDRFVVQKVYRKNKGVQTGVLK